jgi:hypothetical protein
VCVFLLQDEEGLVLRGANTFEGMESDDDLEDDSDEFADGLADEDDDSEDIEVRADNNYYDLFVNQ